MNNPFTDAIKRAFSAEMAATSAAYSGYDPFKDHYEHNHPNGKSYFFESGGNEFGDPKAVILSTDEPDENTKLITVGFEWPDPDEPFERPPVQSWEREQPIGRFVVTRDNDGFVCLKIRENHEELQFFGRRSEWHLDEEDACIATVVLNKENGVWLLATAFPGPAGVHNDQKIMKKLSAVKYLTAINAINEGANTSHVILKSDEDFENL
jgi:hypothetical protein